MVCQHAHLRSGIGNTLVDRPCLIACDDRARQYETGNKSEQEKQYEDPRPKAAEELRPPVEQL